MEEKFLEERIKIINKGYNYNVRIINNYIYVTSWFGEWCIFKAGENKYGLLHHSNSSKYRFHSQRNRKDAKVFFKNLEDVFRYIKNHDVKIIKYKNNLSPRMEKLFNMLQG